MGQARLVGRLVARDIRRRPAQAMVLLLAITAATSILTLGLALHGVTSQPYQQTRTATNGPDVVAQLRPWLVAGPGPGPVGTRHRASAAAPHGAAPTNVAQQDSAPVRTPRVTGYSRPYPVPPAIL